MINLRKKKIIVTFLMHLGDLILITPFLQVLRRHAQGSDITLVVDEKVADVVRYNPDIDHLITIDKKGKDNSISALWHIGRRLHQQHYDILINLHPNERTSFLAASIQAKKFVGMSHFLARPLMNRYTRLDRIHLHAADMYINVLAQLGIDDYRSDGLQFPTSKAWDDKAAAFYESHGVSPADSLIGFNIGSAVPQKRWPAKRFAAVADYFGRRGFKCVFFGGDMDLDMVKEATGEMASKPIVATGALPLANWHRLSDAVPCSSLMTAAPCISPSVRECPWSPSMGRVIPSSTVPIPTGPSSSNRRTTMKSARA